MPSGRIAEVGRNGALPPGENGVALRGEYCPRRESCIPPREEPRGEPGTRKDSGRAVTRGEAVIAMAAQNGNDLLGSSVWGNKCSQYSRVRVEETEKTW